MIHTHTHNSVLFVHKKEGNAAICNNMDGPREHNVKWNKSNRERQIRHNFTYKVESKKKKKQMHK